LKYPYNRCKVYTFVRVTEQRIRWMGHIVHMGAQKNENILAGKLKKKSNRWQTYLGIYAGRKKGKIK
jgi:hypothetical protein